MRRRRPACQLQEEVDAEVAWRIRFSTAAAVGAVFGEDVRQQLNQVEVVHAAEALVFLHRQGGVAGRALPGQRQRWFHPPPQSGVSEGDCASRAPSLSIAPIVLSLRTYLPFADLKKAT